MNMIALPIDEQVRRELNKLYRQREDFLITEGELRESLSETLETYYGNLEPGYLRRLEDSFLGPYRRKAVQSLAKE